MPKLPDEITWLMHVRYPLYGRLSRLHYGDESGLPLEERNRLLDEVEAYEEKLRDLSPKALSALVKREDERRAVADEAGRPFNQPEASADYDHFARLGWWTAEEAVALFLGKNPRRVTNEVVAPYVGSSPFADKYERLKECCLRSPVAKRLSDQAKPQAWMEWAASRAVKVPPELSKTVKARGLAVEDFEALKRKVSELEHALAMAVAEVQQLKQEAATRMAIDRPLKSLERQSMEFIIVGLALRADYDPNKRGNLASTLAHRLELLGLSLSDDTIRNHLKKAMEWLPRDWRERLGSTKLAP